MKRKKRQNKIAELIEQQNFVSVEELSQLLDVSEMTIWRDLKSMAEANLIKRTYGGAIPVKPVIIESEAEQQSPDLPLDQPPSSDVVIITSAKPQKYPIYLKVRTQSDPPIIAESAPHPRAATLIGINDYRAGYDLGCWVGEYAIQHWGGSANVLIWSYDLPNTEARGRGFLAGLNETTPKLAEVISLNSPARDDLAYQLMRDALEVNKNINVIFPMNDNNAWGAIQACIDLKIDPNQTIVIPFGLEGDTLKNALLNQSYCPIALAMFPEMVGRTCVDAAIAAYNHLELPQKIETPYRLLNQETLPEFYQPGSDGWRYLWEPNQARLGNPLENIQTSNHGELKNPGCIGIILTFPNHEWYQNMVASMNEYADWLGITIEILDAEKSLKEELTSTKHALARRAALEIQPGDTIFISGGITTQFMIDYISSETNATVITNATTIFRSLEAKPNITLISTGGILRRDSQHLVGPSAENSLQDLRVDKLFLEVSGVSYDFGLSHTDISEVTIQQAMIRSAREVILLADHTKFAQESFIQIAPIKAVNKLITDSGLPAQNRLQLSSAGIEVIIS
jgi:DeoR family fructose operon transcriptional repressor